MILVFGKTGQVAKELQKFRNVISLDRNEADLSNPESCADAIARFNPEAVINAAAYTAVDKAESEEILATTINGESPTVMAKSCAKLDIPFVHISTDYVFNGSGYLPWKIEDKTNPKNAYGRSKLAGEIGIQASKANYVILRTSWVVSAHGSNFIKTMLNLSNSRKKLDIVADQIGGPTPAFDIAKTCIKIVKHLQNDPSKSNIYHYSGVPDISWADFAQAIFNITSKNIDIASISTSEYPTAASRPLNSRMDCKKITDAFGIKRPNWKEGLNNILKDLGALK